MKYIFPLILMSLLWSDLAQAGAWLQEPGTAYVRMSSGWLVTRERFDENGNRVQWDTSGGGFRNSRYRDFGTLVYAEVGVDTGWNMIVMGGWSHLEAEQPSAQFTTFGFNDFTIGAKRLLWKGSQTVTSVSAFLTVPTGYDPGEFPALGADVMEVSIIGNAGSSGFGMWGTGELEYRFRGGIFRDQIRGAVGGGFGPRPWLGLRGEVRGGVATGSAQSQTGGIRFDPAAVDADFLDLAGTISYITGKGVAVEGEVRTALAGENTLTGTRWSLALATTPAWRWKQ